MLCEGKNKKATTGLVSEYTNKIGSTAVSQFHYTYDEWGNITKIESPISNSTRTYEYNQYSEVTNAVETYTNGTTSTYEYTYDKGGNILTETVNGVKHTYVYDDVWKDKLISYDGKSITYDIFGCPTNYMGKAMEWDIYGNLTSVGSGSNAITYTYMGDGQRRSKTVNGVTTTYHYNNGMLLSETTGDETLRYYYDSTGKVVSFSYKKGEEKEKGYYYARNAQGDIIAVYRSEDSKLMGTYEYDLWGRLISATEGEEGVDTDNILTKNPFRYRSYYYDNETGFYNLNARYYDPEIRRFISADSMSVLMVATVSLECKNLFAYSENNPVTGKDSSGGIIESAFDIVTLAGSIVDVCCHPTDPWAWAGLVGDAVDLIPVVTGVGEGIKGLRVAAKAADTVDDLHDAGNAAETVTETVQVINKNSSVDDIDDFYSGIFEQQRSVVSDYENYLDTLAGKTNGIPDNAYTIADYIQKNGSTMNGYRGGKIYKNIPSNISGQTLPQIGVYKEYDINRYIKGMNRGAERIVIGEDASVWYTNNHYLNFTRIN